MKRNLVLMGLTLLLLSCEKPKEVNANNDIITSDIKLFWQAYDSIKTTQDSVKQHDYLQRLFLNKGTIGLETIMKVRRYKPEEYIYAINNYPRYWESIRESTLNAGKYADKIQMGVDAFKKIYPEYKPARLYFEIGVFRTPGTALDSILLIGAEMAMGDENVDTSELPSSMNYVKDYLNGNPVNDLPFLNVHEYVHSQQITTGGYDLLSQSLFEGTAEFIAELATGQLSPTPAVSFGNENDEQIKQSFAKEMFTPWFYHWIWNDKNNEFGVRDLGYYVGLAIAKKYYDAAADKQLAIKNLIELDYNSPNIVEAFVDETGYFSQPLDEIKATYEAGRPAVLRIGPFENGDQNVDHNLTELTVQFSDQLDGQFRSTGYGELGEDFFPQIESAEFGDDNKSITYKMKLMPDHRYQFYINFGYRTEGRIPLKPYLVDFKTSSL